MLDEFFAQYYRLHPVNATFTGVHDYDGVLPDWSNAARATERDEVRALSGRIASVRKGDVDHNMLYRDQEQLDLALAETNLVVRIAEMESGHFRELNPALWTGEAIFGVVSLMIRNFAPATMRLVSITQRLAAVPKFLDALPEAITRPIPERWRDRAVRECSSAIELFDSGLDAWIEQQRRDDTSFPAADSSEIASVRAAALQARSAFVKTRAQLQERSVAEEAEGAVGEVFLATMLWDGHFCPKPARALLSEAEKAIEFHQRVLSEMLEARGIGWSAAQTLLAGDRTNAADYYAAFAHRWTQIHDGIVAQDAVTWPDWPIRYVPIPEWAQAAQPNLYWLFYRSPAPFDQYDIYDYVVSPVEPTMSDAEQTRRLSAWNRSTITLNHVVHHGGVGHHVQNWNATHQTRSRIGKIAAVDCASRIGMFLGGSMAEGWACYATDLVDELDLLTGNERLSQQHTRVRQLARAIVDIKLHCGDWTFAESANYYVAQTGMSQDMAAAETTKNSMFPGTALMYWLGTTRIEKLRDEFKQYQKASFNLKAFHGELLSFGSIPVYLVANMMLAAHDFPIPE